MNLSVVILSVLTAASVTESSTTASATAAAAPLNALSVRLTVGPSQGRNLVGLAGFLGPIGGVETLTGTVGLGYERALSSHLSFVGSLEASADRNTSSLAVSSFSMRNTTVRLAASPAIRWYLGAAVQSGFWVQALATLGVESDRSAFTDAVNEASFSQTQVSLVGGAGASLGYSHIFANGLMLSLGLGPTVTSTLMTNTSAGSGQFVSTRESTALAFKAEGAVGFVF